MKTNFYNKSIWEQLIKNSIQFPIDWSEIEKQFEIKKLELQKLQPQQIREKRLDFEKKYMLDHHISKSWMENEYRLFTWFLFTYAKFIKLPIEMFGPIQWNIVSESHCKQPLFCKYFYLASKKKKSLEWTTDEDNFIQKMMRSSLNKKWTQIGLQLFKCSAGTLFRKPKSIRERWLSHLNPQIKKNHWDLKQDLQLIKYIKERGRKWSKIAKIFGNRTEHTIKNRYNQLLSKYQIEAKAQKIDFLCLNQDDKIQFMQNEINKYQKISQIKSAQTLPEPLPSQIKQQEEDIPIYGIKVFQPIILSMQVQEHVHKD